MNERSAESEVNSSAICSLAGHVVSMNGTHASDTTAVHLHSKLWCMYRISHNPHPLPRLKCGEKQEARGKRSWYLVMTMIRVAKL